MRKYVLLIPLGLVVLLAGGVLLYTKVIADDPLERLGFTTPTKHRQPERRPGQGRRRRRGRGAPGLRQGSLIPPRRHRAPTS